MPTRVINDLQRARKVYGSVYRSPVRVPAQTVAESDASVLKLDWKESVRFATTGSVSLPPVDPLQAIDGISNTLADGNRILLKDQTTSSENGIYVVNVAGGTWDRASDAIPGNTLTCGAVVYVDDGLVNEGTKWVLQTKTVTLGGSQNWIPFGVSNPASPTNSIQYNNAGTFGGSANFTYDGSAAYLTGSLTNGDLSIALGGYSHAEGSITIAEGDFSHAEGRATKAFGQYSHAEGFGTVASGSAQHVSGKFNIQDNITSLFVIGNGTSNSARSDILRINQSTMELTGAFTPGADNTYNLGDPSYRWAHIYTADLHLRNERGDWTLIEEPEFLTLRNNMTGQRFRLLMEPLEE